MKHTPGPWKALKGTEFDPERWCIVVDGPLQYIIAEGHNGAPGDTLETEEANAHLIAAAPDLLAACEQMVRSLNGNPGDFAGMLAAHRALDAAIAKATGEAAA